MLYQLLSNYPEDTHSEVICLASEDTMSEKLCNLGICVHHLGMKPARPDIRCFIKLIALLKKINPDIIQTWMYHADLLGGLANRFSVRAPLVWNIRHSDFASDKMTTRMIARLCAWFSRILPTEIFCNSQFAKTAHARIGYKASRIRVVPNGFDVGLFSPSKQNRDMLRTRLGLSDCDIVVGIVGRYHPVKDHAGFIKACKTIADANPNVRFLMCGNGLTWQNEEIVRQLKELGVEPRFLLIGQTDDMVSVYNALDILVLSSSSGEAFPNVIGEAMACAKPCVVTDVGDSAVIVGDTGRVVPPGDPEALARQVIDLIAIGDKHREHAGLMARQRIIARYEIAEIVDIYLTAYDHLSRDD